MIYLHYRMRLTPRARQNMKEFWAWLEKREEWFYRDLPMVKERLEVLKGTYDLEDVVSWAFANGYKR